MESWFTTKLLHWYELNKRHLPWRNEKDPYKIWISEIILQQTQVVQGTAYYLKFIGKYPTVQQLARAKEDEVLKLWQGLGYYSRARNLLETAKIIDKVYHGKIPEDYDKIKSFKGVGDYTASAIASFAFDLPYAVLDGNVFRLLSRLFGIKTAIDTSQAKKEFSELATSLLNSKHPAQHNQAIMEFGSQYCKPVNPDCSNCIFNTKCLAFKEKIVEELPFKSKKVKVKKRYFNYILIIDKESNILIEKRAQNDIWKGLYQFPIIETEAALKDDQLINSKEFKRLVKHNFRIILQSKTYKHILTHQHLYAIFYVIQTNVKHTNTANTSTLKKLTKLPFPRLIELFLHDHNIKEFFKFDKI